MEDLRRVYQEEYSHSPWAFMAAASIVVAEYNPALVRERSCIGIETNGRAPGGYLLALQR